MRRWRSKMIFALSGVVLFLAVSWPQSEPCYQGKGLSVWLRGFENDDAKARWESAEALRHIGTKALPHLITRLRQPGSRQEPQWRQRLRALAEKQSLIKI